MTLHPGARRAAVAGATLAAVLGASTTSAHAGTLLGKFANFSHAGTFSVPDNLSPGQPLSTETSAEIIDATRDGKTLIYTDAFTGRIGFIDATNPAKLVRKGTLDVGGSPTSVAVAGSYALVAVDTSTSFTAPTGELLVVDPLTQEIVTRFPLAGQPDSVAIAPSGRYATIVIENQRDEELSGGLIPQAPGGTLQIIDLAGGIGTWGASLRNVDLTGIAAVAPSDPEPEFVDINTKDEAVVSLQENNHLAIVDLKSGKVARHFSAGSTRISGVDATEEKIGPQSGGLIELTDDIGERRREPDAVHWIGDDRFATANEGDYEDAEGVEGGSRSFTIFGKDGKVKFEAGNQFEYEIVRAGHFPQARAANKGVEPEGIEFARIGGLNYLFVGAERANAIGVYELATTSSKPVFRGLLPTGVGPEGIRAIPGRNLLAVSSEADNPALARSIVATYKLNIGLKGPAYPQLVSKKEQSGKPIPWVAISGLSGDAKNKNKLWAVSDSYLAQSWLYEIDASRTPAVITKRVPVGLADSDDQLKGEFDLEGVAARPEGGFWVASEGRIEVGTSRPNLIVRIAADGSVQQSIPLPAALAAGATSSGLEGVTVTGSAKAGNETVYVALQRAWKDDPAGFAKLGKYDVAKGEWSFVRYPLDPGASPAGGWVGLSEITALPGERNALIVERDNQIGAQARVKKLYRVDLKAADWKPFGEPLSTIKKTLRRNVLLDLDRRSVTVPDKLEGVGLTRDGRVFLATDNDGVDGNLGETLFFGLGKIN